MPTKEPKKALIVRFQSLAELEQKKGINQNAEKVSLYLGLKELSVLLYDICNHLSHLDHSLTGSRRSK